ncbi:MAG: bifunctional glutamate N-acetyltransferase/amino-acid acetyltransferase ArgJ [Clostridia bacterium]|nr:bifunctional glutamate N-acetyltransferase/amino-acid acetyltransferase ArgJ [Clostridia bacterium]
MANGNITFIEGGVCAAKGFRANGIHCGIRKNHDKRDLSLIVSDVPCTAAAVYTTNLVKGAPILLDQAHLQNGRAQAVICNSGIANTCNTDGLEKAEAMAELCAAATGIAKEDVVVASTGVIGQPLPIAPIAEGMEALYAGLEYGNAASLRAEEGIMTTDTRPKMVAVSFTLGGKTCHLGGIAKGSGMIHPNMATMLVFLTTDVAISADLLKRALREDVQHTFNMTSVDGDTSTNDTCCILASGLSGNAEIMQEGEDYTVFMEALNSVTVALCREIAGDGEGATRLLECSVRGAASLEAARKLAKSVICSSLVKAAMFGADANWGRVLCALGYAGVQVDVTKVDVRFRSLAGEILVCKDGCGVPFDEDAARKILLEKEIDILVSLGDGEAEATAWGCDLSYDYVKINGDYRT